MKFTVLTLFPEIFEQYLSQRILQRAVEIGAVSFSIVNIRDYAGNRHNQMDDVPFGGGAGMVLKPEAYWNFFSGNYGFFYENSDNTEAVEEGTDDLENRNGREGKDGKPYVVFMSPQGRTLTHEKVKELTEKKEIVIISGRYEGLDQRVIDKFVDEEISIGDYVLSSGDLPALVLMDSVTRIREGVIKRESFETDSFFNGLLGFPQYTRPVEIDGHKVPEVLRSGNHARIDEYRQIKSIQKTIENRGDLFEKKLKDDPDFRAVYEKLKKKLAI